MANTQWNASDKTANVTLSNLNLTATQGSVAGGVRAIDRQITGKFYWEYTANTIAVSSTSLGVAAMWQPIGTSATSAGALYAIGISTAGGGTVWRGSIIASGLGSIIAGTVIGIALDLINYLIWFKVLPSGNWNGSATASPATGAGGLPLWGPGIPVYPYAAMGTTNDQVTANFGDSAFIGAVPVGFTHGFTGGTVPPLNEVLTEIGTETWGQATPPDMRLTQAGAEVWGMANPPTMQLTQVGVEVWGTPVFVPVEMALTQVGAEVWATPIFINTEMALTQIGIEVWATQATDNTEMAMNQIGLEVWASVKPAPQELSIWIST